MSTLSLSSKAAQGSHEVCRASCHSDIAAEVREGTRRDVQRGALVSRREKLDQKRPVLCIKSGATDSTRHVTCEGETGGDGRRGGKGMKAQETHERGAGATA